MPEADYLCAGAPHDPSRIQPGWNEAPEGYYPSNEAIMQAMDAAYDDLQALLSKKLRQGTQCKVIWDEVKVEMRDLWKLDLLQSSKV